MAPVAGGWRGTPAGQGAQWHRTRPSRALSDIWACPALGTPGAPEGPEAADSGHRQHSAAKGDTHQLLSRLRGLCSRLWGGGLGCGGSAGQAGGLSCCGRLLLRLGRRHLRSWQGYTSEGVRAPGVKAPRWARGPDVPHMYWPCDSPVTYRAWVLPPDARCLPSTGTAGQEDLARVGQ